MELTIYKKISKSGLHHQPPQIVLENSKRYVLSEKPPNFANNLFGDPMKIDRKTTVS